MAFSHIPRFLLPYKERVKVKVMTINDDDHMASKTFMEGEGHESFDEGIVSPSQV